MKLLLDQSLSRKLVKALSGLYPGSVHVTACSLESADDAVIWDHARQHGFAILTKDTALLVLP